MFGKRARKKAEQEALRKMMEEAEANRRAAQEAEYAAEQEAKFFYESEIMFDEEHDEVMHDYQYEEMPDIDENVQSPSGGFVVALPIHEDKPEENETVAQETSEPEHKEEPIQDVQEEALPQEAQEPIQEPVQEQPVQESAPEIVQEPIQEQEQEIVQEPVHEEYAEQTTAEHEHDGEPEIRYIVDGPVEDDELVKPAKLVKLPNLIDYMLTLKMSKRMKINVAMLLISAYEKFKDIPEEKEIVIGCMKKVMFALMK